MHFGTMLKFAHQFTKKNTFTLPFTRTFTRFRRTRLSHEFSRNFAQISHEFRTNLAFI